MKIKGVEKREGQEMDAADAIAKNMFNIALQLHDIKAIMANQAASTQMIQQEMKLSRESLTDTLYQLLGNEKIGKVIESIINNSGGSIGESER